MIFALLIALVLFMQTEAFDAALECFTETVTDLISDEQPERRDKRQRG